MNDSIQNSLKKIPITKDALVLRTDFTDDRKWTTVCDLIKEPSKNDAFVAYVEFLSDRIFEGLIVDDLINKIPEKYPHSFIFVIDSVTIKNSEFPVLCVDVYENVGQTFRVIPSEMWGIENNLSLANMDFDEFASGIDEDGVFRGFSGMKA